ncbi:hypothetical protein PR048_025917 [Dryococelus australis]|uniref:Uncharacterized protein n=1 Tax=Dryococelus australis TaxID=614101 RepID=A0ABQ9GJW1_9NEOP|nr:hypothetical protein PR048_025917 [Dryococelus australis]
MKKMHHWKVHTSCVQEIKHTGVADPASHGASSATTVFSDSKELPPRPGSLVMSLRRLGPALGFLLSSFCLSMFVDPTLTPIIGIKDPRWLGAWWLGWLIMGMMKLVIALLMAFFPRAIPVRQDKDEVQSSTTLDIISSDSQDRLQEQELLNPTPQEIPADLPHKQVDEDGFFRSLWRIMKNKILVYNSCSALFSGLVGSGTMTYSLKYLETQFHTSAAGASIISGSALSVGMVISHLGSGLIISKLKPRPSFILGWNMVVDFLDASRFILYIFLPCGSAPSHANVIAYQEMRMEQCWNARGWRKREIPKKPAEQRHRPARNLLENLYVTPPGIAPGSSWWEASSLTAQPPWPLELRPS